ncbi:MAG: GtrA family protein, partial [Cyanobacteria bacterium P01_F01_bin.3]
MATLLYAVISFAGVFFGLSAVMAHIIAYAISVAVSYFGQKSYTFGIQSQHRQFGPKFIIATAFLAGSQFLLVYGLATYSTLQDYFILSLSTLYYPPASFLVHTFWTFKRRVSELKKSVNQTHFVVRAAGLEPA